MPKTKSVPGLSKLPGYPNIPRPGDIYEAQLEFRLADGSWHFEHLPVLIYDVRPLEPTADWRPEYGQPTRVLWGRVTKQADGWMPGHAGSTGSVKHWHVITTSGMDMSMHANALGVPVTSTAVRISLLGHIGVYKPRDPAYNSIEILRDSAIVEVAQRMSHDGDLVAAMTALHQAEADRAEREAERDAQIRAALERTTVAKIARITGLSPARIYQIRDGRR